MTAILFDATSFRAMFSAFSSVTAYPETVLQLYWDMGTGYVSDQVGGAYTQGLSLPKQTLALNLMTAHLAALNSQISAGNTPGLVQSSSIDKISVSLTPPPVKSQWAWWLNLTPYGAQLLALLSMASVGGFYYGGFPVAPAFRR